MNPAWSANVRATVGGFDLAVTLAGDTGVLALVGPNGSGKTTLLRCLAGAIAAQDAEIRCGDRVLASTSSAIDLASEDRRIGYVPQGYGLFPHLDVRDNVAFGLSTGAQRLSRTERHRRAEAILRELECSALARRRVARLSGGEQQRVALARALVLEPELLLLDEPLAALDASTRRQVRSFLAERLAAFGRPTLLVTHDLRDLEALADQVAVLDHGRIIQRGTLTELRAAPASDFVAELVSLR